jgi:hypothetical protein
MAEFEDLRRDLRLARASLNTIDGALAAARTRLRRIAAQQGALDRIFDQHNQRNLAERGRLQDEKRRTEAEITALGEARGRARANEVGILKSFARFTDPRDGITRLDDGIPILLMPVRIETRFRRQAAAGAAGDQLWLRIYPDDFWIDSFDPTLTDNELKNAQAYWAAIWQAGGVEDQKRGAWRGLAGAHGSGRAAWIVESYQPVNIPQKPAKPRPEDVILTIPVQNAEPADGAAVTAYWRTVWLADGDAAAVASAWAALETAVAIDRAREIVEQLRPVNFDAPLAQGATRDSVNLGAAFVVFPAVETKQTAWAHAPKMKVLPDRFVFIGYRGLEPPLIALGNPVPSPLIAGPDPSAAEADQLKHDDEGNVVMPDELKWLSDFDRAVEVGMGLRIDLTPVQARGGFDRVLVIGLRLNADADAAKGELETLLRHHAASRKGFSLVPQGTPTNNTEASGSGFGWLDDPDRSFDDRKAPAFTPDEDWLDKCDGQWLAEYLGIDPAVLATVANAGCRDQRTERAMNIALWPATIGYWMETMMAPVFPRAVVEQTREFFNRYVMASGAVPTIRIGAQPYGILPATTLSRMAWLDQRAGGNIAAVGGPADSMRRYLARLRPILAMIDEDWRGQQGDIAFVGKSGDPHQILLDIVGLHSGSVEWSQRYAESLGTLHNRRNLLGFGGSIEGLAAKRAAARQLLTRLGYVGDETPQILDKIFSGKHNLLKGGVVDDKLLSETETLSATTTGDHNYIQWLIDAAGTSLQALYAQDGFRDDKAPGALLYILLRHALQLGYHDVSVRLHENAGLITAQQAVAARSDVPFLHIREHVPTSESRYQPLYAVDRRITGNDTDTVGRFIGARLNSLVFASSLREQRAALERLKGEPTARLERAFADHVDCCSYRLDAWFLGIVNYQLSLMRNIRDRESTKVRQGIHLGAYAWLEELRPENKVLTPVRLTDPDLVKDFGGANEPPLMRDSDNEGYIHAPSLNHAVTAAVLRNGYISNASAHNRKTMAVNLTSERVRTGLALLEGIRAGQGLGDLLGYQFERGLHDRHGLAEVDQFIFKLRKAFPLRADRMVSTKSEEGVPIEAIEARNVIDGLAFAEHMRTSGQKTYPFGKSDLPDPTDEQRSAINAEADRVLESHDAVADLALAEGVYQAVLGNYDRVASTYDAYARGNFPPEPDIVRTPQNGVGLTHRVAVHLPAGTDPGASATPRAQAEPAINAWLAALLPPPAQVACMVSFRAAATGATVDREVTLGQLALQPADLLALVRDDNRQAMTELDDRIVDFVVTNFGPRPDVPVAIRYMEKAVAPFSVFDLMPLVRNLQRLVTRSRPLKATDLQLMNEAKSADDSSPVVHKERIELVQAAMQGLRGDLAAFQAQIAAPLADLENRRAEILADVDAYVATLVPLLARAALFVVPQAGWGFAYYFRRRTFGAILRQCDELTTRWNGKLAEFQAAIDAYDGLPGTATDRERYQLLRRAERAISTVATYPLPPVGQFRNDLEAITKAAFVAKLEQFAGIANTTQISVAALRAEAAGFLPVTPFDVQEFTLTERETEIVSFVQDAANVVKVVIAALDRRIAAAADLLLAYDQAAAAADRASLLQKAAKALLGDDFMIIPEFALVSAQGDEFANALAASTSGDLFVFLTAPPDPAIPPLDLPVDTWLYGVARVREKMQAYEQTMMLAGALGRPEPELTAVQLPFQPGDRWLALEFPPEQKLDQDRLLYTAHFAELFDKTKAQCGLLLDEWAETIPGGSIDTGITFHYDRPNCEAPQTMLLVTPSAFRGAWQWADLVDALNETLDFAKRRAIEPKHIDRTAYAPFLPATIMATQVWQLTIAANLALNNKITFTVQQG